MIMFSRQHQWQSRLRLSRSNPLYAKIRVELKSRKRSDGRKIWEFEKERPYTKHKTSIAAPTSSKHGYYSTMKLLLLSLLAASNLIANEPKSLINAINAVFDAREALVADLADDESNVRSEYTGCSADFAKILKDEKTYNAAVKVWLNEMK
jgi:hypothetical protein